MSEWRRTDEDGQPVYDDDRLLAFALGLDDDPALVAAAAADAELRRRLDEMRADVAAIGGQLTAAVPVPDAAYADPADPRWAALHEYFAPPKPARGPWRRRLRILAPAAVVAVALVIGLGIIVEQAGRQYSSTSGGAGMAASSAERTNQADDAAGAKAAPTSAGSAVAGSSQASGGRQELTPSTARSLTEQAKLFAAVVVARASRAAGDVQRFTVLRVLKGEAPGSFTLTVLSSPAKAGALHVVFLHPLAAFAPAPTPAAAEGASPAASPAATAAPSRLPLTAARVFRYEGAKALVRALPGGVDPASVRLR